MALGFFFVVMLVAGHVLSEQLWQRSGDGHESESAAPRVEGAERLASSATCALAVTLALTWLLALAHLLTRNALLTSAAITLAGCALLERRRLRTLLTNRSVADPGALAFGAVAFLPLAVWLVYVLWRALLFYVQNHDGLAYHMPRAVLFVRAAGFGAMDGADARMTSWPANYELLLADVIVLERSDLVTEWVGTATYVFFLIVVAAMAARWWGRGLHAIATALVVGAMPIALLHAGAHKNDLLACALFAGAALFASRWAVRGGIAPLLLAAMSIAMAVGTKLHSLFLVVAVAPVLAWGAVRAWRAGERPTVRASVTLALGAAVATTLLGPVVFVVNWASKGTLLASVPGQDSGWSDFNTLWMFPYLVLTVPFSTHAPSSVWVPWAHAYWHWDAYDLFFSHFGWAISVLVVFVPFGVWRFRRAGGSEIGRERALATFVLVVTSFLVMPLTARPLGFFACLPRYMMFLPAIAVLWTLAPVVRALETRRRLFGRLATIACAVVFALAAVDVGARDINLPYSQFRKLVAEPEPAPSRKVFGFGMRAASVVDFVAGPDDHIAIDGAFDTWSYPAYGADLRRRVSFLHATGGAFEVPADADWVIVDRAWHCWFGHPGFKDFSQWDALVGKGEPLPEDLVVFNALARDPHFVLVYRMARFNQAVFRRVQPP